MAYLFSSYKLYSRPLKCGIVYTLTPLWPHTGPLFTPGPWFKRKLNSYRKQIFVLLSQNYFNQTNFFELSLHTFTSESNTLTCVPKTANDLYKPHRHKLLMTLNGKYFYEKSFGK